MNHFFCANIVDNQGYLSENDSHHANRVLRLKVGDTITVSANDGKVFLARIKSSDKKSLAFDCLQLVREEKRPLLNIAIAPTKSNDRFEWFLEKATEMGVHHIFPIITANSERKIYKNERGQKVIMAAAKQSKKGFLPQLHEIQKLDDFFKKNSAEAQYIAHLVEGSKRTISTLKFNLETIFLIGPEGDFNEKEVELALNKGFEPISLGEEVLRTETAGLKIAAAASLLK
jgi:16S rRNA (uracil1498-N3)-methyltransferase